MPASGIGPPGMVSFGDVTLHWLADHMCDHDQEHLDQARDALA